MDVREIQKMIISEMQRQSMSYGTLSTLTGIAKSTLQRYVTGTTAKIPMTAIQSIELALNVEQGYLMGWNSSKRTNAVKIPVLGTVIAGIPMEAVENIIDYEEISPQMASAGEYFCLQVKGQSMQPKFSEGDVVVVRKQPDIDSGDIAIVLVNGNEATIKKVKKQSDGIMLIPLNPAYDTMFYNKNDIKNKPVTILGKVVELRAKF